MLKPSFNATEPLDLQVERALLEAIGSGRLAAGERLAPTATLAAQWEINPIHLQRALQRLARLGYLERKPRLGTVVRARRKRSRVAVLIENDPKEERFHSLRKTMQLLDAALERAGYDAHFFDNLHQRFAEERDTAVPTLEVSESIRALRPVALIDFGFDPVRYQSMQWALELPRVRYCTPFHGGELSYSRESFFRLAFGHLARNGFRRTLLIARDSGNARFLEMARRNAREQAIEISRTILIPECSPEISLDSLGYKMVTQALSRWQPDDSPREAMIVVDDILLRGVARALEETGPAGWREWEVVVLGVKGIRHRYPMAVTRVEIPLDELVTEMVRLLEAKLLKRRLPPLPIEVPCRLYGSK
ncbi:MAG TPA: GntR family transcriptional regulator [Chthoniobacteraceae bacterium]|nr:GntR family transcriptional regulator [Chthoniobacteraceae bacterium]